jgi:hypothetical protein
MKCVQNTAVLQEDDLEMGGSSQGSAPPRHVFVDASRRPRWQWPSYASSTLHPPPAAEARKCGPFFFLFFFFHRFIQVKSLFSGALKSVNLTSEKSDNRTNKNEPDAVRAGLRPRPRLH